MHGYDVGCKFAKRLATSELGGKASESGCHFCVPLFHGHAHNRMCQLYHLGTYIKGMGLEDLETCERIFSRSNALAPVIRHASTFHRHQAIRTYFEHNDDVVTFQSLSVFLYNNVVQSVKLLEKQSLLKSLMVNLKISSEEEFPKFLDAEKEYLTTIKAAPAAVDNRVAYLQSLIELEDLEKKRNTLLAQSFVADGPATDVPGRTAKIETNRRQTFERFAHKVQEVQAYEEVLDIRTRWTRETLEWKSTHRALTERDYRRAIDKLEAVVVSRIFELTKMNMSGTGYKLRKHIAKALQVRSQAIRTALEQYNTAAAHLGRRTLQWDEVVEFGFLAEFDVLQGEPSTAKDMRWATPASREAMDLWFKIQRAKEELERCRVESCRLLTYMRDEEEFLEAAFEKVKDVDAMVAFQLAKRRAFRKQLHNAHRKRLAKMLLVPGLPTGWTVGVGKRFGRRQGFEADSIQMVMVVDRDENWQDDGQPEQMEDDLVDGKGDDGNDSDIDADLDGHDPDFNDSDPDFDGDDDLDTAIAIAKVASDHRIE